jgi:hypothetical protein
MNRILFLVVLCFLVVSSASAAPATATISVDCNLGQKINNALNTPAVELTIEISGICIEDVAIDRNNVTLRGTDPTVDGISSDPDGPMRQALSVRNVDAITVENLKLTGAFNGIGINDSVGTRLVNCRLEDNEFAGAIVGSSSGSIFFFDTVVSAPTPPTGARLSRGIWVTNGSNASCFNCTISDYREALQVSTGASLFVNGGLYTASRNVLQISNNSSSSVFNATLDGRIRMTDQSAATLINVDQSNDVGSNQLRSGSNLIARFGTALEGFTAVSEFTNVSLLDTSSISGDMQCDRGGDAYCDSPVTATSSSNCGQCANPPPP